jgi:Ca-activated chloride channel family protein
MELFANPSILIYLPVALALMALLLYLGSLSRAKITGVLFSAQNYKSLAPRGLKGRRLASELLFMGGFAFIIISLAAPQWGREKITLETTYSQAALALDVSASMLAQDAKPNRLESAKTMFSMLLENIKNERVGLIAFTSQAYLQCPVTTDSAALKERAGAMHTDMLPAQGTALAPSVSLAARMLGVYPGKKALVLITDGEDHHPQDLQAAVAAARENDIKIITVGIGSAEGELIPVNTATGGKTYKKDAEGKTVVTRLDETALVSLAKATGGVYIKYTAPQTAAEEIAAQLSALDKSTSAANTRAAYKNRYRAALLIGMVFLLASILIPHKKGKIGL